MASLLSICVLLLTCYEVPGAELEGASQSLLTCSCSVGRCCRTCRLSLPTRRHPPIHLPPTDVLCASRMRRGLMQTQRSTQPHCRRKE